MSTTTGRLGWMASRGSEVIMAVRSFSPSTREALLMQRRRKSEKSVCTRLSFRKSDTSLAMYTCG